MFLFVKEFESQINLAFFESGKKKTISGNKHAPQWDKIPSNSSIGEVEKLQSF